MKHQSCFWNSNKSVSTTNNPPPPANRDTNIKQKYGTSTTEAFMFSCVIMNTSRHFTIFRGIVARGDRKLYNAGEETGWINNHDQNLRVNIRT